MNCKVISHGDQLSQFNVCSTSSYQATKLSSLGSCSRLSFGVTKLTMPSLSAKSASESSFKTIARASTIETYCTEPQSTETLYDLLGISESVTFPEIKKAYKQLARKYHPDVSPADCIEEHTRMFIMVKEAYETLSDPHTKSVYDRDLSAASMEMEYSAPTRTRSQNDMGLCRNKWQSQVHEERRNMNRTNRGKASCGARMRRQ